MPNPGEDSESEDPVSESHGGRPPEPSPRPPVPRQALHVNYGRNIRIRDTQARGLSGFCLRHDIHPDLRFEKLGTFVGVRSLAIH
jgi:hypothetical protein